MTAFGLTIASELALPDLPPAKANRADVSIRFGRVADAAALVPGYTVDRDSTVLRVPGVATFRIAHGREIVIDPDPDSVPADLRLFALGSAMGALLHQRGVLPLHANGIAFGGTAAVAFMGPSGSGKSTLAGWFHDRGHPILSDDVCAVLRDEAGGFRVEPGIPRLRLWDEALRSSGRDRADFERSFSGADKYDVPIAHQAGALPLRAIYLLRRAARTRIVALTGVAAVQALAAETYRAGWLSRADRTGVHVAACAELARAVPVFAAERVWGHDRLDEVGAVFAAHAAAAVAAPPR